MEDAPDGMVEDSIGSAKPLKPPKPRDPERTKLLLLKVIAVAAVAAAVGSGITAWETHQHREMDRDLYCLTYAPDEDSDADDESTAEFYSWSPEEVDTALGC